MYPVYTLGSNTNTYRYRHSIQSVDLATNADLDKPTVANGHLFLSLLLANAKNREYPLHFMVITDQNNE